MPNMCKGTMLEYDWANGDTPLGTTWGLPGGGQHCDHTMCCCILQTQHLNDPYLESSTARMLHGCFWVSMQCPFLTQSVSQVAKWGASVTARTKEYIMSNG